MATKKGAVGPVTPIILVLVGAALLLVIAIPLFINWTGSAKEATQAHTTDTVKQAVLVQTRNLPDLKITAIGAISCNRNTKIITLPTRLGNFGEATAVAADEDEGLIMCGESVKYTLVGGSNKTFDSMVFTPRLDTAGRPVFTELTANTRSSTVNFDAKINDYSEVRNQDCPNVLRFDPQVDCRDDLEELNEDNNALARVQCNKLLSSCASGVCSYECFYEASRNSIPATI